MVHQSGTHKCSLCKNSLPREAFLEQMWRHRNSHEQNAYCINCCHPKCTRKKCKTCKICRREDCDNKRKCKRAIASLHYKHFPNSIEESDQWSCRNCRLMICQSCGGRDMPRKAKQPWTCGGCKTLEISKELFRKYT